MFAAIATVAAGPAASGTSDDKLQQALAGVLHPVPVPIAFYEKAALFLRASMRRAVEAACTGHEAPRQSDPAVSGAAQPTEWLCSHQPLVYLRAVYVTGERGVIGYVCYPQDIESLRYYPPDMFVGNRRCVRVWYGKDASAHFIEPADLEPAVQHRKR